MSFFCGVKLDTDTAPTTLAEWTADVHLNEHGIIHHTRSAMLRMFALVLQPTTIHQCVLYTVFIYSSH